MFCQPDSAEDPHTWMPFGANSSTPTPPPPAPLFKAKVLCINRTGTLQKKSRLKFEVINNKPKNMCTVNGNAAPKFLDHFRFQTMFFFPGKPSQFQCCETKLHL